MAPLTKDQLIQLAAAFGPSLISGIGQGGQAAADRALTEQDRARQAEQELYNRRMGARAGLAGFFQNQLTRDINAAGDFAAQSPLGAEQALARQTARMRAGGQAAAQYRPPTGMSPAASAFAAQQPNFLAPFGGADYQATVSPEATARSIAERRKALAAIDPNFQFGSMGDFGLPDLGGEVSQYQGDVRSRRQASEMDLQRLLTEQMREASAAQIPGATSATAAPTTGATTTQKKPSLLKRIANVALTAAPIVAAPFTGGTSLALIGAGAGAAQGLLNNGGLKGALTGGLTGAASSALLGGAGRVPGQSASSAIKKAILNPQALTQLAGSAVGGQTGDALKMLSAALPGASGGGRTFDTSFEQRGLPNSMLPTGGMYKGMTTDLGKGPLDTSFEQQAVPGLLPGGGTLTTDIGPAPRRRPAAAAVRPQVLRGVNLGSLAPSGAAAESPRPSAGGATVEYGTPSWIKASPRAAGEGRVSPLDAAYADLVRGQATGRLSSGLANMPEDSLGLLKAAEYLIEASPAMIAAQVGAAAAPGAPAALGRIASAVRGTPPIQMEFGKTMTGTARANLMQALQKSQDFIAKHKSVMLDPNIKAAVKARWNASPQVQQAMQQAYEVLRRAAESGVN